jgi:cytochrome c oxidase assembly protein subunit 15
MNAAPRYQPGLHRYALALAASTLLLLFVGGLVTSTGSGLSVPDWPLSFGQVFPAMRGGVLFEHGHRMVATAVGLLTIGLALWLHRAEERAWLRRLGLAAVGLVILQGVLGGLTVLLRLPTAVSVAHAGTAELFFCLTTAIAVFTSRGWIEAGDPAADQAADPAARVAQRAAPEAVRTAQGVARLALVTVIVVYGQILLGALVRHSGAGLAIPDFPLAYGRLVPPFASPLVAIHFAHRVGALVTTGFILATVVRVLRTHGERPALRRPALLLVALVGWQIFLGAVTVWSHKAVIPTTLHLASGALILATSVVLALRTQRLTGSSARSASRPAVAEPAAV